MNVEAKLQAAMFPFSSELPVETVETDKAAKVLPDEANMLTQRVRRTVGMIQRRQKVFQKYAQDISGKTGLGAIAALAYISNVILRREPVWGDLLMIVMRRKPAQVEQSLLEATRKVLAAPIDKEEWAWFRDNLLSTFVWFAPSSSVQGTFVYETLLQIAEEELGRLALIADALQFQELQGIESVVLLPGGEAECRQDHRRVGNAAAIKPQLLQTPDNREFYDLNVYLNQLRCIANLVDPPFQRTLRQVFEPLGSNVTFQSGPLKNVVRSRAKAQSDYGECQWPTSAHLIDLIRCSVTFQTAAELAEGLSLLQAAAGGQGTADDMNGGSFEIARVKNGFAAGKGGYRDVKVNVVFLSAQGFALIGEVALCLTPLVEYKERTHELYEILREKAFFREVTASLGERGSMQFSQGPAGSFDEFE